MSTEGGSWRGAFLGVALTLDAPGHTSPVHLILQVLTQVTAVMGLFLVKDGHLARAWSCSPKRALNSLQQAHLTALLDSLWRS